MTDCTWTEENAQAWNDARADRYRDALADACPHIEFDSYIATWGAVRAIHGTTERIALALARRAGRALPSEMDVMTARCLSVGLTLAVENRERQRRFDREFELDRRIRQGDETNVVPLR